MSSLPSPYMINFGISPYFKCQLIKEIHVSLYFVVSYDESLNQMKMKMNKMNKNSYWNECLGVVETRCFDSKFLKRTTLEIHTTRLSVIVLGLCH